MLLKLPPIFCLACFAISLSCNNKDPYSPDYKSISGYVIQREICHTDENNDDWLIDFSYNDNQPHIGDTLTIDGRFYTNVAKVRGLDARLRREGLPVGIDYKVISSSKITPQGCENSAAATFALKQIIILNQVEIR